MDKEKFLKRYEAYDEEVKEYMKFFADAVEQKHQEIPDIFIASLDILAGNLTIMTKAMKSLVYENGHLVGKDNYRGEKKSTELSAFLAAQNNVIKIISAFGWNPLGKSRIRENTSKEDAAKLLENLMS